MQDFSHQQYSNRLVALHPWSGWSFFEETLPVQIEYTLLEFFPVFFPVTYSCVQFPAVAFQLQILFTLGEAFASSSLMPVQIEYTLLEFFPVFFQLHILVCSFLQLHSSCNPVANSSCKFYLHWGKHSQTQKLSKQILIRYQVSMSDELANASPNVNRICN